MTNYQSALIRVKQASTVRDLDRLERSLARVYDAGQLNERELGRLYTKTCEKAVSLLTANK